MSADRKLQWETPELIVLARNRPEEAVLCGCKTGESPLVEIQPFFWGPFGGGGHHHRPRPGDGVFGSSPVTYQSSCYTTESCGACKQALDS